MQWLALILVVIVFLALVAVIAVKLPFDDAARRLVERWGPEGTEWGRDNT